MTNPKVQSDHLDSNIAPDVDQKLEFKVLKAITVRESILVKLRKIAHYKEDDLQEDGLHNVQHLLAQIRGATVNVIEAIERWRASNNTPNQVYHWKNVNYLIKITYDINFLSLNTLIMNKLDVDIDKFRYNPLMLPNTINEPLKFEDPAEQAIVDNGGHKYGTMYNDRIRLRIAEKAVRHEHTHMLNEVRMNSHRSFFESLYNDAADGKHKSHEPPPMAIKVLAIPVPTSSKGLLPSVLPPSPTAKASAMGPTERLFNKSSKAPTNGQNFLTSRSLVSLSSTPPVRPSTSPSRINRHNNTGAAPIHVTSHNMRLTKADIEELFVIERPTLPLQVAATCCAILLSSDDRVGRRLLWIYLYDILYYALLCPFYILTYYTFTLIYRHQGTPPGGPFSHTVASSITLTRH